MQKEYCVRALHCDYKADDETIYAVLKQATAPLTRAWEKLRAAKTIAIKFNQDYAPSRTPYFEGIRQQLVSDGVARRRHPPAARADLGGAVLHRHVGFPPRRRSQPDGRHPTGGDHA
jgi:hypothetical protein